MLAPVLAWRLWQRLSPSPFMVSMSSTEEARRTLCRLSRERLRARLQLEKAACSARRSARGDEWVTGGSGAPSPISAAWSSGWVPPGQLGSSDDVASSGPDSLLCLEKSTTTASGGSCGSDCLLPASASSAGSFRRKDLLRPGRREGQGWCRCPRHPLPSPRAVLLAGHLREPSAAPSAAVLAQDSPPRHGAGPTCGEPVGGGDPVVGVLVGGARALRLHHHLEVQDEHDDGPILILHRHHVHQAQKAAACGAGGFITGAAQPPSPAGHPHTPCSCGARTC